MRIVSYVLWKIGRKLMGMGFAFGNEEATYLLDWLENELERHTQCIL